MKLSQRTQENLRAFSERVAELLDHQLIKEDKLRAASPTLLLIQSVFPDTNSITNFERIDDLLLRDFARIIRFFDMKNEPSSVVGVIGSLRREGISPEIEEKFASILDLFERRDERTVIVSSPAFGQIAQDFGKMYNLYVNGHIMHGQRGTREEWKKYTSSELEPYFYTLFVCALINKTNAVINLYAVLRDAGYIEAI